MKPTILRLARPCSLAWEQLSGEGDARQCEESKTIVHDLDALGPRELRLLIHEQPLGMAAPPLPRCYRGWFEPVRLIAEIVEGLEPALGIEPRTC
jgi:hypothetical protein